MMELSKLPLERGATKDPFRGAFVTSMVALDNGHHKEPEVAWSVFGYFFLMKK